MLRAFIQGLPADYSGSIQLGYVTNHSGLHQMKIDENSFYGSVWLLDKNTGKQMDISTSAYSFNTQAGVINSRFEISFENSVISNTEELFENSWYVYQLNDRMIVQLSAEEIKYDYQLLDMSGRILLSGSSLTDDGNQLELDVASIPKAAYLLTIKNNNKTSTKRILIK